MMGGVTPEPLPPICPAVRTVARKTYHRPKQGMILCGVKKKNTIKVPYPIVHPPDEFLKFNFFPHTKNPYNKFRRTFSIYLSAANQPPLVVLSQSGSLYPLIFEYFSIPCTIFRTGNSNYGNIVRSCSIEFVQLGFSEQKAKKKKEKKLYRTYFSVSMFTWKITRLFDHRCAQLVR